MTFLRRVLKVQGALWALFGVALAVAPGLLLRLLNQPPMPDGVWLRMAGVMAIVLAMLMVLVSEHLKETWWWAWSFALLGAGTATVFVLNALVGLPDRAAAWPWWAFGVVDLAFAAALLWGLARSGQENPFV
ncbi:MAG: hypothetical protein ACXVQJ_03655 [Actinomycetota bacterium]